MGRGGWRWVGDFFTKMDEGGEKGEEEERRYSCDSCDSCDSFQGEAVRKQNKGSIQQYRAFIFSSL